MQYNKISRVNVIDVLPVAQVGQFAAKLITNEVFPVTAKVFMDGHNQVGATIVVVSPTKKEARFPMCSYGYAGDNNYKGLAQIGDEIGRYQFYVEGYKDLYQTWKRNAEIKIANNQDIEIVFAEIVLLFEKWISSKDKISKLSTKQKKVLENAIISIKNHKLSPDQRLYVATSGEILDIYYSNPLRDLVSPSVMLDLDISRKLASFASWYEFFPRSEGAKLLKSGEIKSGTFTTATKRLQDVKDMGFDIIYLPPIHPIGKEFRKGKNNSLEADAKDPGSPWAVQDHWKFHQDLGTERTFKNFVTKAKGLGLEVALDLALQCSPDHPWVKEHPEWFNVRPDGSIAYAENPPKKYQDIYPINFDNDLEGITNEIIKLINYWASLGVSVIRVDNPHTKPVQFWENVIKQTKQKNPDLVYLAEAFTLPAMMKTLGYAGFDQSHCYFLWRNTKEEISEYFSQISGDDAFWYRASFWPTTPDNLTDYLAHGSVAAHAIRAVLAALGSTTWGIYAGYELVENSQRVNQDGSITPEHVNSEKYEIKVRDWSKADRVGIKTLLTSLNNIRKNHVACQNIHSLYVHTTNNPSILAFSRHVDGKFTKNGKDDTILVVVNLDPHNAQKGTVYWDWAAVSLPDNFPVIDELTGRQYDLWRSSYVDLAPVLDVAHVFHVIRN